MIPKQYADALSAEHLEKIAMLEKLCAEMAKTIAELKAGESEEVTEAEVPEAIADSIVSKRLAVLDAAREGARRVAPTVKLDGITKPAAIHAAVVAHHMPTVKLDGLDARVVEGMFTAIISTHDAKQAKRSDGDAKLASVLVPSADQADAVKREDAQPVDLVEAQRAKMRAWGKAPLGAGKAS